LSDVTELDVTGAGGFSAVATGSDAGMEAWTTGAGGGATIGAIEAAGVCKARTVSTGFDPFRVAKR
jgi:hypothetical protein